MSAISHTVHLLLSAFIIGIILSTHVHSPHAQRVPNKEASSDSELAAIKENTTIDFSGGDFLAEIPTWGKQPKTSPSATSKHPQKGQASSDSELAAIKENTTIDFSGGDFLAEIPTWDKQHKTSPSATSKHPQKGHSETEEPNFDGGAAWERRPRRTTPVDGNIGRLQEESQGQTTVDTRPVDQEGTNQQDGSDSSDDKLKDATNRDSVQPRNLNSNANIPPYVTWPSNQDFMIVSSPNFHVQCHADGNPRPTFRWYRNEQALDDKGPLVKAFNNGSLIFAKVDDENNGYFQCRAENKYGTSLSLMVLIKSAKEPTAKPTPNSNKIVEEWDPTEFRCAETPPTVPAFIKRWYRKRESQRDKYDQLMSDERVGIDEQGIIRFAYVTKDDQITYACGLTPASNGKLIRFYNEVKLEVNKRSGVKSGTRVAYTTTNLKAVIGHRAVLECFFSGYPLAKVQWQNNTKDDIGSSGSRYTLEDYNRKLIINKVQENDQGTFICTGSNGLSTAQGFIVVNVTSPPMRVENEGLDKKTFPDHKNITLKCKTRAAPEESVDAPRWYRNGRPLNEVSLPFKERYHFSSDHTELYISKLDKELDTACFQCNVSNSEGHLFMDGYLRVINSIQITKQPADVILIDQNTTYDLTVAATGDACCEITKFWHFNGSLIEGDRLSQPPFIYDEDKDTLTFDSSTVEASQLQSTYGDYRCRLTNTHQTVNVHFRIASANSDKKTETGESSVKLWWIVLICAFLAIVIAVAIIVFFMKSNYPRSTYMLEKTELKHNLDPKEDLLNQSFQEV